MVTLDDLLKSGVHIGHKKSKWNPKMAPFVFGVR
ncbi:MAG: 30S ribosomal protein S2, partial [Patescibacteria group bacterium]